ncbi:hypothetical protein ACSBR1_036705 [Camellia fascicularis]
MKIPIDASWTVRKMFKVRDIARPCIESVIGNGKNTYLWHDNWHPLGPLYPDLAATLAIIYLEICMQK